MEKKIEVAEMSVSEIGTGFGNPRKIKKHGRDELEQSLEIFGDFGLILVDENNDVIAGNQRLSILKTKDPETKVLVKRLIGYSEAEKRAINIKDNTHSGDWDLDLLADWTADLSIDVGIINGENDPNERKITDMELIRYEKYDYVLVVCKNEVDYNNLTRDLGIDGAKVLIHGKRKINARAIWYDRFKQYIENVKGGY